MSSPVHRSAARLAAPVVQRIDIHGLVLAILIGWIALGWLGQMHLVLRDSLVHSVDLLFDDAYYYLGVAWNIAHGHGSKFTEPLFTNGYHPLWLLTLAGLADLFDLSKQGLFCLALTLTALVKCLGIWLFDHRQPDAMRRTLGRVAIFIAMVKFPFVFSFGMETTLFVLCIPWLLRMAQEPDWTPRRSLIIGLASSIVFLTRLDALALDVAVLALALATRRASLKAAAVAAVPLALTIVLYAAVNQSLFGTPVPISGQAKAIGAHLGGNLGTTADFFASLRWSALMLMIWALGKVGVARQIRIDLFALVSLGLALVACAFYYGLLSGWPIWPWYLYPNAFLSIYATIAGLTGAAAIVASAIAFLSRHLRPRLVKSAIAVVVGAVAVSFLFKVATDDDTVRGHLLAYFLKHEIRNPDKSSFNKQNVALIPWLTKHYPDGATIAMGDRAGGLGYWMPEKYELLQIEGLVADKAFLQTLASGTLGAYLRDRKVDLYVTDRPRTFAAGSVMGFVEPVQPRMTNGHLNVLCFDQRDQLLGQDYAWDNEPQLRRVFDFGRRMSCPAALLAEIGALQPRYDAIRSYSGF